MRIDERIKPDYRCEDQLDDALQKIEDLKQQNVALVKALKWAIARLEINKGSLDVMTNELNKAIALAEGKEATKDKE